ncbi:hypothetical protein BFR45_11795 [Brochothrix thermosphacta]|nr:hypothetical protein BFR45_11795 [Brochothrix thermosphacta]
MSHAPDPDPTSGLLIIISLLTKPLIVSNGILFFSSNVIFLALKLDQISKYALLIPFSTSAVKVISTKPFLIVAVPKTTPSAVFNATFSISILSYLISDGIVKTALSPATMFEPFGIANSYESTNFLSLFISVKISPFLAVVSDLKLTSVTILSVMFFALTL